MWRLLHDTVVPLDYAAFADYMLRELAALGEGLDGRFDLSPLIAGAAGAARQGHGVAGGGGGSGAGGGEPRSTAR